MYEFYVHIVYKFILPWTFCVTTLKTCLCIRCNVVTEKILLRDISKKKIKILTATDVRPWRNNYTEVKPYKTLIIVKLVLRYKRKEIAGHGENENDIPTVFAILYYIIRYLFIMGTAINVNYYLLYSRTSARVCGMTINRTYTDLIRYRHKIIITFTR